MKKITFILFAFAALLPGLAPARLNVVATTPDLGTIAREIGGDAVRVTTLARPTEDPHFVDARPSFIAKLHRADAVVEGGAELEIGWLPALLDNARNPRLAPGAPGHIACAEGVAMLEVPASLDRSKGDIHAAGNPHFMVDPVNAKLAARHICDAFSQLDPDHADGYRARLDKFESRIDARLEAWRKELAPYRGREVVAYHDAWVYFARRFGLSIDLFLEPKPGIPPTPANLAAVIARMKAEGIRVILVQPYQNRKTAERVAEKTGAVVVDAPQFPGGVKGTDDYIALMDYLVSSVARAMAGGQ